MFNKKKQQSPAPGRGKSPSAPSRPMAIESAISIIGPGMVVEGDVKTEGTVRVEGTVRGTIRAGKAVVLGKTGEINGDVLTQDAVIGGKIVGTIVAEGRLELQGTCSIEGEVRAAAERVLLQEGARFNGNIKMIGADEEPTRSRPPEVENLEPA
jgi:cytoskeletal protein CcmA (bactofilin family)